MRIVEIVTHARTGGELVAIVDIDRSAPFSHGPTREQLLLLRDTMAGAVQRLPQRPGPLMRLYRRMRKWLRLRLSPKSSSLPASTRG